MMVSPFRLILACHVCGRPLSPALLAYTCHTLKAPVEDGGTLLGLCFNFVEITNFASKLHWFRCDPKECSVCKQV
ncbi:hypothetical protein ACROYT_G031354 [Oculina patagonica]